MSLHSPRVTAVPVLYRLPLQSRPGMAAALDTPMLQSDVLLRGSREALIRHGDDLYRLRHTRNGKLILTK